MAVGDTKIVYGSPTTLTNAIASLASDANLLAGYESATIDNTSTLFADIKISGTITTGTSPTASKTIQVWVIGTTDGGTTWPDVFDGTTSAETATSANVLNGVGRRLVEFQTDSTSNRSYSFTDVSVGALYGGTPPPKFVLFTTHNTGVNLKSDSQSFTYYGVYTNTALS